MVGEAYMDLLVATLTEHEKALDLIADKLEKIVAKLNLIHIEPRKPGDWIDQAQRKFERITQPKLNDEPSEEIFADAVGRALSTMPEDYQVKIEKIRHTAYIKVTWTEPKDP